MRTNYTVLKFRPDPAIDKTYRARHGSRSFAVQHDGRSWLLRGWTNGKFDTVQYGKTASALMQIADDLAAN